MENHSVIWLAPWNLSPGVGAGVNKILSRICQYLSYYINLKLTEMDFFSSIIHAPQSQIDILPVIWTLLNFVLYIVKKFR